MLTLDWIKYNREKDILKKKNIDIENIASDIIQHFLDMQSEMGFHVDMHQGNLLINESGQIVPIDFGIMGRLES